MSVELARVLQMIVGLPCAVAVKAATTEQRACLMLTYSESAKHSTTPRCAHQLYQLQYHSVCKQHETLLVFQRLASSKTVWSGAASADARSSPRRAQTCPKHTRRQTRTHKQCADHQPQHHTLLPAALALVWATAHHWGLARKAQDDQSGNIPTQTQSPNLQTGRCRNRVQHSIAIYGQLLLFCDQSMRKKAWRSRNRGASGRSGELAGATRLRQARPSSACTFFSVQK
jgi:hypothetical protein